MKIMVTGGLGFIGSAMVRLLIESTDHEVVNVDKISYSSTQGSLAPVASSSRYGFQKCDLADAEAVTTLVDEEVPDVIIHLAAESHVDRSIDGPGEFVQSNIIGTFNLLEAARRLPNLLLFTHVSTDEVFGSLQNYDPLFNEHTRYDPRSPYSATKAASDHLVRAWGETYDLPCVVTNCSNNYGPYQFPEKLIPTMILKASKLDPLPIYGDGGNIRDWLHVDDHVAGLLSVVERGEPGRSYMIGGGCERTNLEVVEQICDLVADRLDDGANRRALIEFVTDRPGHDRRYAVDSTRIQTELGWKPRYRFEDGIAQTVDWYLSNPAWWEPLLNATGAERLGLQGAL